MSALAHIGSPLHFQRTITNKIPQLQFSLVFGFWVKPRNSSYQWVTEWGEVTSKRLATSTGLSCKYDSDMSVGTPRRFLKLYIWQGIRPFVIAAFFVFLVLLCSLAFQRIIIYPFVFLFFGAVMCSAWFGGAIAGLLSVLLSSLAIAYFFVPPLFSIKVNEGGTYMVAFIICATVMSWMTSARKRSEEELRESRDKLEERVIERTYEIQQVHAELASLSRRLSMGELAAAIAHELNQPLTAVVTHAYACREWLKMEPVNLKRASVTAEKIVRESTRASAIVARVRALFQKEETNRTRADINRIVQGLVRLLRDDAAQRSMTICTSLASDLPRVIIDAVEIQQVLLNIARNGLEAMTGAADPRELWITTERNEDGGVLVTVRDCGPGLDPELTEKIFQPFFTTKPQGIGLGLAISRSIIEAHDGRLWATPLKTGGMAFQFTIPAAS